MAISCFQKHMMLCFYIFYWDCAVSARSAHFSHGPKDFNQRQTSLPPASLASLATTGCPWGRSPPELYSSLFEFSEPWLSQVHLRNDAW